MGVSDRANMASFQLVIALVAFVTPSFCAPAASSFKASASDLLRASTQAPRNHYKGAPTLAETNMVLNGHLARKEHLATKACESFTLEELQQLSRAFFADADAEMLDVYSKVQDNRRQIYESLSDMEEEFKTLTALAAGKDDLTALLRDGMCHRVVMWFVHHLSTDSQLELAHLGISVPLLPKADHTQDVVGRDDASRTVHRAYDK